MSKKLQNLRTQQPPNNLKNNNQIETFKFSDRIKNFTNTKFTDSEKDLLNKGLNHCIYSTININELENIAVNIESSLIKNLENYMNKTISAKIFEKTIQSNQNKINSKEKKTLELLK